MKKVVCVLLVFLIVFTSCFVSLPVSARELEKIVVLDPGHGGTDPGASGNGYDEKDLNWDITIACKEELERFGITVYLTKTKDETVKDLAQRAKAAKDKNADVLVSIHNNSFTSSSASGTEVYHSIHTSKRFFNLASDILSILTSDIGTSSRGVKTRLKSDGTDDYYGIIRNCDRPAVLVECAFITSPSDIGKIASAENRIKAGKAIAHGILKQYGIDYTIDPEKPPVITSSFDIIKGEKETGLNRFFENQWPEFKDYKSNGINTSVFYKDGCLYMAVKTKDLTDNFDKDKLILAVSPYEDLIFSYKTDKVSASKYTFAFEITKKQSGLDISYIAKGTDVKSNIKDYIFTNLISHNDGDIYLIKIDYKNLTGKDLTLNEYYYIDGVYIDCGNRYTVIDNGDFNNGFSCTVDGKAKNVFKVSSESFVWYQENTPNVDIVIKQSDLIKNISYTPDEAVITPIDDITTFEFKIDTGYDYRLFYDYNCSYKIEKPISLKDDTVIVYAVINDKKYKVKIQKDIKDIAFDDLERDSWYFRYVDKVVSDGILKGYYENGKVLLKPENNATRIESVIFVLKYLGIDVSGFEDTVLPYCDLKDTQKWAEDYLKASYKLGIMKGEERDGKYYLNGGSSITRGEFFAMLARALMSMDTDTKYKNATFDKFSDKSEIEKLTWFEDEFKYLVYNNIVSGNGGRFDPKGYITRSQIIKLMAVA